MKIFYFLCFILFTGLTAQSQAKPFSEQVKTVRFYPNPAVSKITFSFDAGYDKTSTFQIFNFIGKKVLDLPSVLPTTVVDLTDFYRGVYIFQVRDKSGKVLESGKFQVAR
ncbi:MAG: T9SS type A sorting domain-containing protein [Chitinophagaceae bacterium]